MIIDIFTVRVDIETSEWNKSTESLEGHVEERTSEDRKSTVSSRRLFIHGGFYGNYVRPLSRVHFLSDFGSYSFYVFMSIDFFNVKKT